MSKNKTCSEYLETHFGFGNFEILSRGVSVQRGRSLSRGPCLVGGSLSRGGISVQTGVSVWEGLCPEGDPSPRGQNDRQVDKCKNTTFPQLRLRAVTIRKLALN